MPTREEWLETDGDYAVGDYTFNPSEYAFGNEKYDGLLNKTGKIKFNCDNVRPQTERDFKLHFISRRACNLRCRCGRSASLSFAFESSRILSCPDWMPWDLLILMALSTAMRRGELLNTTWADIDFEKQTIDVSPKKDTPTTWPWHIKDNERRSLPLTEDVVNLLSDIQAAQPEGYPYVFLPPSRYDHIQQRRKQGKWTVRHGICPVNNFTRHFQKILEKAGIDHGEFHDLRRTCLTQWLTNGLSEYDVMQLAGHSDFETTRRFYLAVSQDLVKRARAVSLTNLNLVTHLSRAV